MSLCTSADLFVLPSISRQKFSPPSNHMAAPKGNKNGRGKKGASGRPSAYAEVQNAHWHSEKWEKEQEVEKLAAKIKTGVYSVRDIFLYKALTGSEKILGIFADKLLPDLVDIRTPDGVQIDLLGEGKKRVQKYL